MFADEHEFYPQLSRLLQATKVPVILTGSNSSYICNHLLPLLRKSGVEFEMLKYNFRRPSQKELQTMSTLIKLFEGPISKMLRNNEQLLTLSEEQVKMMV